MKFNHIFIIALLITIACIVIIADIRNTEYTPNLDQPGLVVETSTSTITPTPTITPVPSVTPTQPLYVTCSDYKLITDRYKTPSGFYIVAGNETYSISPTQYNTTSIGYSAKTVYPNDGYYYFSTDGYDLAFDIKKIKQVSEAESGYRDACVVVSS